MTKKQVYMPPVVEEWLLHLEGPLCGSGNTESLPDFDPLEDDITWDIMAL